MYIQSKLPSLREVLANELESTRPPLCFLNRFQGHRSEIISPIDKYMCARVISNQGFIDLIVHRLLILLKKFKS